MQNIVVTSKDGKLRAVALFLFLHLIWIVNATNVNNEIVTLQKENHIKCITEDLTSAIYVVPPSIDDTKYDSSLVVNGAWTDDDWYLKSASSSIQDPVADKRWEDFETTFTRLQRLTIKTSISLWVYATGRIQFFMSNEESIEYKKVEENKPAKWIHFNIILKDGNVILLKNNEIILTKQNFVPTQVVVKASYETYWKIQEYNYKWADTITQDAPATLTIPATSEKKCLIVYASVCQECFLDIVTPSTKVLRLNVLNDDSQAVLSKSWQLRKIDIEPGKENIFRFNRGRNDEGEQGEWQIDVRSCPDILNNNKVIYEINSVETEQTNRTCHLLETQDNEVNSKTQEHTEKIETLHCEPGMLGSKCDISCNDLLGSEYQYCQLHRVCENYECTCAWGFHGPSCQMVSIKLSDHSPINFVSGSFEHHGILMGILVISLGILLATVLIVLGLLWIRQSKSNIVLYNELVPNTVKVIYK